MSSSLEDWHGEKTSMKMNVFVKPKEQSDACFGYALARKRA